MKKLSIILLLSFSIILVGCNSSEASSENKRPIISSDYEESKKEDSPFILTNETLNHSPFAIENENVYFPNWKENNRLSQTKLPTDNTKIFSKDISNQYDFSSSSLVLVGNKLYFGDSAKNNALTSLNIIDNKATQLNSNSVHNLIAYNENLYYINLKDQKLYTYNTETSKGGAISLDKVGKYIINNNFILYQNLDDNNKLYKINIDGSQRKALTDFSVDSFAIFEDEIIVSNTTDNNYIYSVSSINLEAKRLNLINASNIKGNDNKIYFINGDNSNRLCELTITSATEPPTIKTLIDDNIEEYYISDKGIFYRKSIDVNKPNYFKFSK